MRRGIEGLTGDGEEQRPRPRSWGGQETSQVDEGATWGAGVVSVGSAVGVASSVMECSSMAEGGR